MVPHYGQHLSIKLSLSGPDSGHWAARSAATLTCAQKSFFQWIMAKCCLRRADTTNVLPHWSHLYGLSPVCVRTWTTKYRLCENVLPHSLHLYGFSPVCVRTWTAKCCLVVKGLPHSMQTYGFSLECLRICLFKLSLSTNVLSHSLHSNRLSLVCVRTWTDK